MGKDKINSKFSEYAKQLSPKPEERNMISEIYEKISEVLSGKCIQIGSYPRYTSITPVHDLDILYILWEWTEQLHNPAKALLDLETKLNHNFKNPTNYQTEISQQSHSITISFMDNWKEIFWVDIVPAYISGHNEFNLDTYKVPEIINLSRKKRITKYEELKTSWNDMWWIKSDPRGYIEVAKELNELNKDFRKTVKLVKKWKLNLYKKDESLKLKSFHLEQVVTKYFQENRSQTIFDAIFDFFVNIPNILRPNQIPDRADHDKFIDDYIVKFSKEQIQKIIEARDDLLIKLENLKWNDDIWKIFEIVFYKRVSKSERFLFDQKIPVLLNPEYKFEIYWKALQWNGFQNNILNESWQVENERKIVFWIKWKQPDVDLFKWKVRNDISSENPRWEITDHNTMFSPERTKYKWNHFVECYAIKDGICVSKARQNVTLSRWE